jgi:hypothetical protein
VPAITEVAYLLARDTGNDAVADSLAEDYRRIQFRSATEHCCSSPH